MSKHTPGPWSVNSDVMSSIDCGKKHIAMVNFWNHPDKDTRINHEEHHANARLIAAAPDLLEALKVINMFLDDMHILPIDRTIHDSIIMKSLVLKVIAKATEGKE